MIKYKSICAIVTAVIVGVVFGVNGYGYIKLNGAGGGYGGGGESAAGTGGAIEGYIIEGAGYFLGANSDVQALLRLVELRDLQGMDTDEYKGVLESASANMEKAVEAYGRLVGAAEITPYDGTAVERLKAFDYKGFLRDNGFNAVIFGEVQGYLGRGDITGVFKETYADCKAMACLLEEMRDNAWAGNEPDIRVCRKLNESLAEMSLFGSYVAGVFEAIL